MKERSAHICTVPYAQKLTNYAEIVWSWYAIDLKEVDMVQTFVRIFGFCILALFVFGLGFAVIPASTVFHVPALAYTSTVLGFAAAVLLLVAWLDFKALHEALPPPVQSE